MKNLIIICQFNQSMQDWLFGVVQADVFHVRQWNRLSRKIWACC